MSSLPILYLATREEMMDHEPVLNPFEAPPPLPRVFFWVALTGSVNGFLRDRVASNNLGGGHW